MGAGAAAVVVAVVLILLDAVGLVFVELSDDSTDSSSEFSLNRKCVGVNCSVARLIALARNSLVLAAISAGFNSCLLLL